MRRPLWITVATAGAVVTAVLGAGFALQQAALKEPPRASLTALRAAGWLERYRLVDSTFTVDGGAAVHGRCVQTWFHSEGRRRRGALLRLDNGVSVLAVPPHTLVVSGGTAAARAVSPLVMLELGGCPRVLARRMQTLAQQRRGLVAKDGTLSFALAATHVTVTLDPRSGAPTGIDVAARTASGSSSVRFLPVTARTLAQLTSSRR